MRPYNGYRGRERDEKAEARRRRRAAGLPAHPEGPCAICGDPTISLEAHAEDYSRPYRWDPPAEYALCKTCHKNKLHKRFSNPSDWEAWKAHIRRGGHSSDLAKPDIAAELKAYKTALQKGRTFALRQLRPRVVTVPNGGSDYGWTRGVSPIRKQKLAHDNRCPSTRGRHR